MPANAQTGVRVSQAREPDRDGASAGVSRMPANDSAWMHWLVRSGAGKAKRQRREQPGQTENPSLVLDL
jgi:hypothetical protein